MKRLLCASLFVVALHFVPLAHAFTTFTLNPLSSVGTRGDGSIQPGDSLGNNPLTGNDVVVSAPGGYGIQPGDLTYTSSTGPTNGYNIRGLGYDPVSGNLILVDTHSGSGGSATFTTNAAIYVLDPNSGQILGALNTNGIVGGNYTHVAAGVADDGVVYVCNQVTASSTSGFKLYRWGSATDFTSPPVVAFTNVITPSERLGETMDVRGAGANTQIIVGPGSGGTVKTNVYLFTTADGTNFTPHLLRFPQLTNAVFNDGIAFGPGNTFYAKQVGQPLYFLGFDPVTYAGSVLGSYSAVSATGADPLLNLAGIAVDNVHHLLAGVEEIGGTANGGRGKVWLFDIANTNQAPAILASRTYIPNFVKATATMGYLHFAPGRLYANVVNNGLLASSVDAVSLTPPAFVLPPDFSGGQPRPTDLPASTRVALGQTAHFEAFATPDVTNYQWYANNVPIPGATASALDLSNARSSDSGTVFKVVASNAAGSAESTLSTLTVVSAADFFHLVPLWSAAAGSTNYITSSGGASSPNERTIAYNALSNQLLVVRGPSTFANLRIFVLDADTGAYLYSLATNGITGGAQLTLAGIGVADDGAVYASSVNSAATGDQSFKVYRWADIGPSTLPQVIFGTNASVASGNPIEDLVGSQTYRFGDALAVQGAGNDTEILVDSGNSTQFAGILRPQPDGSFTNWTQTGYLLQNAAGSYGFQAYGTAIGRSLQFGPSLPGPYGSLPTFWQKRYNATGAPLAGMGYNDGGGLAVLSVANTGLPLFTNGPVGVNFSLKLAAAINFATPVGSDLSGTADTLSYYDLTDPSQAVLLSQQALPVATTGVRKANANAIAQILFGANPLTGSNYLFVLDGNNGLAAFGLAGGVVPPPDILAPPQDLKLLAGSSGTLSVQVDQLPTIAWFKGTNAPVDTGVRGPLFALTNAQAADAGDYFVIASNVNGSATSRVAHVTIGVANDNYSLAAAWRATAGDTNFPYVTGNGGANTPNERTFAYHALSNQLIVVSCPPNSTAFTVWVVDAATGTNYYSLNTTGVVHEGSSEVGGSNPIDLAAAAVADDGAVYLSNETPNGSGGQFGDPTKTLHIYRWADTAPATAPVLVYQGDPSGQPPGLNVRWGDVLTVRGAGTNTELFLNSNDGTYGAVLRSVDSSLTQFTNVWFYDASGAGSIGRSVQFGNANTVYEKRKGTDLVYSRYDTENQSSTVLGITDFASSSLGGVFVDEARHLAAGVDFVGSSSQPDALALYDLSQPASPMLLGRYAFPGNQVANANFITKTIIAGWRVYALDANNGLSAFYINPPVNSMVLDITNSGTHVTLHWGNPAAVLQGTANPGGASWVDLTAPGQTNASQAITGPAQFFRLIQRR